MPLRYPPVTGELIKMEINEIVREIDAQVARLVQARGVLTGVADRTALQTKRGRPSGSVSAGNISKPEPTKPGRKLVVRPMSQEARARIAAAQKARWAKSKQAAKSVQGAVKATATVPLKKSLAKKSLSAKKV